MKNWRRSRILSLLMAAVKRGKGRESSSRSGWRQHGGLSGPDFSAVVANMPFIARRFQCNRPNPRYSHYMITAAGGIGVLLLRALCDLWNVLSEHVRWLSKSYRQLYLALSLGLSLVRWDLEKALWLAARIVMLTTYPDDHEDYGPSVVLSW